VKGWYRSAKALQGLGRHEAAAQAASRALQLEPANKEVRSQVFGTLSACFFYHFSINVTLHGFTAIWAA
jgi:hypothetical protein